MSLVQGSTRLGDRLMYYAEKFDLPRTRDVALAFSSGEGVEESAVAAASRELDELYSMGIPSTIIAQDSKSIGNLIGKGLERSDYHELGSLKSKLLYTMVTESSEIRILVREYIEVLSEIGPVAYADDAGMVDFTHPSTDADDIEAEFDHEAFCDFASRNYKDAVISQQDDNVDLEALANEIAMRYRRLMGIDVDTDDLEKQLNNAEVESEEFYASTPEEKVRYYADPKWYTRFF